MSRFEILLPDEKLRIKPPRSIYYGPPKIGKSTFASKFPSPIFIQAEDGVSGLNVSKIPRTPLASWDELMKCCDQILKSPHEMKTLVVDTIDRVEHLSRQWVLKHTYSNNKKDFMAYFKGPVEAGQKISELLVCLDQIRDERGMNIIVLSHEGLHKGADELGEEFKKTAPSVSRYAWEQLHNWADQIGHITNDFRVVQGKARQANKGRHIVFSGHPGKEAGTRAGYEMPKEIKLNFEEYLKHTKEYLAC